MSDDVWRSKTEDDLLRAANALSDYTEEGQRLIRAELKRRDSPNPPASIGECPCCRHSVSPNHSSDHCTQCDELLPAGLLTQLRSTVQITHDEDSSSADELDLLHLLAAERMTRGDVQAAQQIGTGSRATVHSGSGAPLVECPTCHELVALDTDFCYHCGDELPPPLLEVGPAQDRAVRVPVAPDGITEEQLRESAPPAREQTEPRNRVRIQCPYCSEQILATARKCRHCGEWLDRTSAQVTQAGASTLGIAIHPKASKAVLICALGLLGAFFLPWVQLFGFGMSGYNLGRIGSYGNYAWLIPMLAGGTIWISFFGDNRRAGAFTGIVPLGAILYGLDRLTAEGGNDATNMVLGVAGHILSIGAWLTIIFGIGIIIAAFQDTPTGVRR